MGQPERKNAHLYRSRNIVELLQCRGSVSSSTNRVRAIFSGLPASPNVGYRKCWHSYSVEENEDKHQATITKYISESIN